MATANLPHGVKGFGPLIGLRRPFAEPAPGVSRGLELLFQAFGLTVGIFSDRAEILDQLIDRLPPGWRSVQADMVDRAYTLRWENGDGWDCWRLYRDETQVLTTCQLEHVLDVLEAEIRLFLAEMAQERVFVHAGVVAWKGAAILIPGRSFSGKTTLVAQLVKDGATYYSDEYAVLGHDGLVFPFPKDLSIRREGEQRQSSCPVRLLGGVPGIDPVPVGLVVLTRFRPGSRWRPKRISKGQAVLDLLSNSVSARRQPNTVLETLKKAVLNARFLKGLRGEAADVSSLLLAELERG